MGFTLLELLVVLAVFGFILAVLGSGVRFASRAVQSADRQRVAHDDLDPVQATIRALIGDARAIEGSSDEIKFVGPMPEALGLRGSFDISLMLSDDRLVARWRPHRVKDDAARDDADDDPPGTHGEAELAHGITDLSFAYYVAGSDGKIGWHSTAPKRSGPRLVRLDVTLTAGDRLRWPDLVVAPGIDTAQGPS
jgi:prepilin-type N-terminal cleavage/methylation domain-containing protein